MSFLYPTDRYVNALRSFELCADRSDLASEDCDPEDLEPNPLFQDLSAQGGNLRSQDVVFLAGIVGVPWQDLRATEDASGDPHPTGELHFQTATQMAREDTWMTILGLPEGQAAQGGLGEPVPPTDPLMIESIEPRTGANPITGDAIASPDAGPLANPINGHERRIADRNDLQYACIFPLPEPKACDGADATCPCRDGAATLDPICQDPATGRYGTTQHFDRAYPGPRFLGVLRDMGANAITASICARETSDPAGVDFGYEPAMRAIIDAIEPMLRTECLPR